MKYTKKQLSWFKQTSLLVFLKHSNFKLSYLNEGIDEVIQSREDRKIKEYLKYNDRKLLDSFMLENDSGAILNYLQGLSEIEMKKIEITRSLSGNDGIYFVITENFGDEKLPLSLALISIYPIHLLTSLRSSTPSCRVKIEKRFYNQGIFKVIE